MAVRTRGHPGVLIFLGILFSGIGIFMHFKMNVVKARISQVAEWPSKPATIIGSEVVTIEVRRDHNNVDTRAYPRVVYSYELRPGRMRTNETLPPAIFRGGGFDDAYEMLRRFPAGAEARVRVNPSDPYDVELEGSGTELQLRSGRKLEFISIGTGLLMAVGGTILTIRRRAKR
jgi:Protein of unknown function (DUF3592)